MQANRQEHPKLEARHSISSDEDSATLGKRLARGKFSTFTEGLIAKKRNILTNTDRPKEQTECVVESHRKQSKAENMSKDVDRQDDSTFEEINEILDESGGRNTLSVIGSELCRRTLARNCTRQSSARGSPVGKHSSASNK